MRSVVEPASPPIADSGISFTHSINLQAWQTPMQVGSFPLIQAFKLSSYQDAITDPMLDSTYAPHQLPTSTMGTSTTTCMHTCELALAYIHYIHYSIKCWGTNAIFAIALVQGGDTVLINPTAF